MKEIKLTEEETSIIKKLVINYEKVIAMSNASEFTRIEYERIKSILNKLS